MTNSIEMYRGNDRRIQITVKKSDGSPFDLLLCTINMYIKKNINDLDIDAIISKQGTINAPTTGVGIFNIIPADTEDISTLKDNVSYYVDFEVTTANDKKYTVLRTTFTLLPK